MLLSNASLILPLNKQKHGQESPSKKVARGRIAFYVASTQEIPVDRQLLLSVAVQASLDDPSACVKELAVAGPSGLSKRMKKDILLNGL